MASKHRTILVLPAQALKTLPLLQPDSPDATREATAVMVEALLGNVLAKDDLLGRMCASLVVARIRRGGQR